MIILKDHHVEQTHAVVFASAQLDGDLIQHTHPRRRFARIEHFGLQPLELFHINGRLCRHAAHTLHDVEQDPFSLQQRDQSSLDVKGNISGFDPGPVLQELLEFHLRIQAPQHPPGDFNAGQNTVLFHQQFHPSALVMRNTGQRRMVAVADILPDRQLNQFIDEGNILFFHNAHVLTGQRILSQLQSNFVQS